MEERNAITVLEVISSDDDEKKPASSSVTANRNTAPDADGRPNKKARKGESLAKSAPLKLFATLSDVEERAKHDQEHWSRTHCWTLREMLGFDVDSTQSHASIEWLVISNYLVDFEFLLDEIPELLSIPQVVVFYGNADTRWSPWKAASPNATFVRLDPSDRPGPNNPLRSQIPYGVHHSKMFLAGFSDGTLRVIIHTANLRFNDVHVKTQAAYIETFSIKANVSAARPSDFENALASYLQSYRYQPALLATASLPSEGIIQRIRHYDYSPASVVLVPSIPGYHSLDSKLGHLGLKHLVRTFAAPVDKNCRIICQFSSIGSLTEKYLSELQESMSAQGSKRPNSSNIQLSLVYPTVDEIRTSVQGYQGGGSVPGTVKNVSKPFLQRLFCRWSSKAQAVLNPLHKPRNVPHIKSYYQVCPDGESLSWLVLSSHNLSKAAWGDAINTKWGGRKLFIRHWELGVFLSPQLLGVTRLVPWTVEAARRCDRDDALVPIPYNIHPESYYANDQPWAVDGRYALPDSFGRFSTHDP